MALPVYSTRLCLLIGETGSSTFVVPAGYTCVVRDLDVTLEPTGGANILLFVAGALIFIAQYGLEPQFTNTEWRGRAIALPGETVELTSTDTASGHVSGYLLTQT